jgi:PTH2 family peptidyl-tRNA hydrolase
MRRGKEISQGSHVSMMWLVERVKKIRPHYMDDLLSAEETEWMNGLFTKVTVQIDSEKELLDLYNKAISQGLTAHYVTDVGKTEFGGIPTITALAIGPNESEKIDLVTSGLKLY